MGRWAERSEALKTRLKLRTEPIAFRRLADDDELVVALPPEELDRVIEGLDTLARSGFGYPISVIGGFTDPNPFLAQVYPDRRRH
jgi:hypothetical protein